MRTFQEYIEAAAARHASDLHLSAGRTPCCRVNGALEELLPEKLTPEDVAFAAEGIMQEEQKRILRDNGESDFAAYHPELGRFRINVFRQRNSLTLVAKILNSEIPTPESLGIPLQTLEAVRRKQGLILVTGPSGSGKTTTLASLIDFINRTESRHVIMLEDPIEYLHPHVKSIVNQREIGKDARDIPTALRAALRQDPDVIYSSELPDLESMSTALTAAETGHLVLSALHTVDAASTVDRFVDVFPPYQQQKIRTQLADVLLCVISQQLLPRADGEGFVAAMEILLTNGAIRSSIREGKSAQIPAILQINRQNGTQSMDDAILELFKKGEITKDTALIHAHDRQYLRSRLSE